MRQENSQAANRRIAVAAIRLICKRYAIDPRKRRHGRQAGWDRCVGVDGVAARIIISECSVNLGEFWFAPCYKTLRFISWGKSTSYCVNVSMQ